MDKHKCKLCLKTFANGRALGGHMRGHMMNLPIQSKPDQVEAEEDEVESASSSSEDEGGDEKGLSYGLRENPKKSFRLVDPEFAFAAEAGSVVLQDRESETESSKNPTRRRSKRTRKLSNAQLHHHQCNYQTPAKKIKFNKLSLSYKAESSWVVEPEPVSSISDATTEEDVAFCLMMLSRDKWKRGEKKVQVEEEDDDDDDDEEAEEESQEKSIEDSYESEEIKLCKTTTSRVRGKYKCETCSKVFRSYQALGGHRASHKKIRVSIHASLSRENAATSSSMADRKIHECPVCFRVFSSGQALGGHKRSHLIASSTTPARNSNKFGENLIDLNLPAPVDDEDISQFELSAVSDAEFVNHFK